MIDFWELRSLQEKPTLGGAAVGLAKKALYTKGGSFRFSAAADAEREEMKLRKMKAKLADVSAKERIRQAKDKQAAVAKQISLAKKGEL
tara:strand:- start:148 stop:414 length:267 start_codon:yes stop_codon:yes gene_type:complete